MRRSIELALCLGLLLPSAAIAETVEEALAASEAAFLAGQREEATAVLESRIERAQPGDDLVPLHGTLGNLYLESGEYDQALEHFDWLIAQQPDHPVAHYKRGQTLERASRASEAIESYTTAGKLGADEAEIRARIGFNHMLLASSPMTPEADRDLHLRRARGSFKRAIELDPQNQSALGNLADILFNQGEVEQALEYYLRMDVLQPSSPTTLARIGSTYLQLGRCERALDHLQRASELVGDARPANQRDVWIYRDVEVSSRVRAAECLIQLQRPGDARAEIERVLEIANCESCGTTSREISRSKEKAHLLLEQLDVAVPASSNTDH